MADVETPAAVPPLDLALSLHSSRFHEHDDNWLEQERELLRDLEAHGVPVRRAGRPADGSKGLADTLVVALTSAAALRTVASCWRAWLQRDRTRSVEITYPEADGTEQRLRVDANRLDDGQFERLFRVLDELGRRRWPR
ncbi:hypothetical protein ACFVHW_29605 [Streptomyces sp. NPDC127110]|uniref:effector-associated constant component EACC1 n=1 Tax=Streptomyces sp. NPDC127110 TaxID=3345362 RepID=UPI00363A8F8E